MIRILLVQMMTIICLAELCAQSPYYAKYSRFNGKNNEGYFTYDTVPTDFPINGVASDFGPRWVGYYDWHGGIDFNGREGSTDFGDLVLAIEGGKVHLNGPTYEGTKFIIIQGDDGHNFAYQHILNRKASLAKNQTDEINHEGVKLRRLDGDNDSWAMIICSDGNCTAIGPTNGDVTFTDELSESRTILVNNTVTRYQAIASLGNTWREPNGYPPHLHLQIMQYLSGLTLPFKPDAVGIYPLSVIEHTEPSYEVKIIKNAVSETTVNEGIDIVANGKKATKIKVRCKMLNEANGPNYVHGIGNVNSMTLKYKYNNGTAYKDLVGGYYISKIEYGGILGAATQVSYPRKGSKENMHFSQGTWGKKNGITPRAYSDAYGYPWDDFYFNDFYTRIHQDHKVGDTLKFAETNSKAKYKDGKYQIDARMKTVKGNEVVRTLLNVKVDNFCDHTEAVNVRRYLPPGPIPVGGNNDLYIATTYEVDPDPLGTGDARLITTKEITEGCWEGSGRLVITITASEPMKYMNCEIPILGTGILNGTTTLDSIIWSFITPLSYTLTPGTNYALNIIGQDTNGNDILNMATYAQQINSNQWSAAIPARIDENNVFPHWLPNPTGDQIGIEKLHSFKVIKPCTNPPAIVGEIEQRGEKESCPQCFPYNQFLVHQTKLINGAGSAQVNVSYPLGCNNITLEWKNSNGIIVGAGVQNTLPPGNYCVKISYNNCCVINKCFTIESCKKFIENIIFPDCLPETPPVEVSLVISEGITPTNISWSVPGNQPNVIINNFGKHFVSVTDQYGCSQMIEFELSGSRITSDVVISSTEICGFEPSVVTMTIPSSIDTLAGWSWNIINTISDEYIYDENVTKTQFTFDVPGSFKFVFYSPDGCEYEKPFTIIEKNITVRLKDYNNLTYCNSNNPNENTNDGMIEIEIENMADVVQTLWIGPDMNPGTFEIDLKKENLKQGNYLVLVIFNGNNCSSSVYVNIGCCEGPGIPQGIGCTPEITAIYEPGGLGSIILDCGSSGGQQLFYKWEGDDNFHPNSTSKFDLQAGTYCVTVTNGCTERVYCYEIVECYLDPIVVTANIRNTCEGFSAGKISTSISGGTSPYKFKWSNGKTTQSLAQLAEGQYCVTVTDKNFCGAVQCFNVLDGVMTTMSECNEKCHDTIVDTHYPIENIYHEDDCRVVDRVCQNGYVVEYNKFVGTHTAVVQEYTNTCILQEQCLNGKPYGPEYIVPKDTVPVPGQCKWEVKCATETLRTFDGTYNANYTEHGIDPVSHCAYAFKEKRCSFGDLYTSDASVSTLTSSFQCPAPLDSICIDDDGIKWTIDEGNQHLYCWQYFYENGVLFHSECQNAGDSLGDCMHIVGWETFKTGEVGYRSKNTFQISPFASTNINDITVYPNPTNNHVTISAFDFKNAIRSIRLYDRLGNTLWTKEININQVTNDTYNVEINYPSGLYIISIVKYNGDIIPLKIIKI